MDVRGWTQECLGQVLLLHSLQEHNQEEEGEAPPAGALLPAYPLELPDCINMVSAVLLEIPYMAAWI
ncbi:hypothetical protein CB1_000737003 [Camelus ferus]|nr:hypothetical protein CB1_000737003 [Camelus ferus]